MYLYFCRYRIPFVRVEKIKDVRYGLGSRSRLRAKNFGSRIRLKSGGAAAKPCLPRERRVVRRVVVRLHAPGAGGGLHALAAGLLAHAGILEKRGELDKVGND